MNKTHNYTSHTSWIRIASSFLGAFLIGTFVSFYNRDDIVSLDNTMNTSLVAPTTNIATTFIIEDNSTVYDGTIPIHTVLEDSNIPTNTAPIKDIDNLIAHKRTEDYTIQTHTIPFLQDKYDAHSIIKDVDIDSVLYAPMLDLHRQNIITDTLFTSIIENKIASKELLETLLSNSYNKKIKLQDNTFSTYLQALMVLHNMHIDTAYRDNDDTFMYLRQLAMWRNILPKDTYTYHKKDTITPYEALEMMRRTLKIKDMKAYNEGDIYHDFVHITPSYDIENNIQHKYIAHSSLLSDSSVWLPDLSNYGFAYYYDTKRDNHIFFAHSSIWEEDTTPYGAVLKELLDSKYESIETLKTPLYFIINTDGNDTKYMITSYEKVDYRNIQPLLDDDESVDFMIFTCATDLQYRLVFKGKKVDTAS